MNFTISVFTVAFVISFCAKETNKITIHTSHSDQVTIKRVRYITQFWYIKGGT